VRKFLVIRFSSIGDILLTTPVLRALKLQTGGTVHLLTKAAFASLLEGNPHVDRVIGLRDDLDATIAELRSEGYDAIIDLHHNLRTLKVKRALGVPAHSFPKLNVEKWLLVNFKWNRLPNVHIVDRYFETVKHLGVTPDGRGLDYYIPPAEQVDLKQLLPNLKGPFIAYAFGGQHDGKMATVQKIIAICQGAPLPVVLLGGPEDAHRGEAIERACPGKAYHLAGKLRLAQSGSVLQQSQVVLAHDTGLMHMAAALGKTIVSLWGGTVPAFGMYPYLPGPHSVILEEPHCLRPPSKLGIRRGFSRWVDFIDRIPTERITLALRERTGL
jgi:heptosyltransferase-2